MVNRFFHSLSAPLPNFSIIGQCILCGDSAQAGLDICPPCVAELPTLGHCCPRCALPLADGDGSDCGQCLLLPPPFSRTEAAWCYQPPIAQIISGFKYNHHYCYGKTLAVLMHRKIAGAYLHDALPDRITATPLHWSRLLRRGFNQSEQLARYYAKQLAIPLITAVKRRKATPAQQSLDALQRQQNLRGAFTVVEDVTGMCIALVDDVMTTGATASEISRCLLDAGAAEVHVWCLARTPL